MKSCAMQAYYMAAPFAVERAPTVALCCLRKHRSVHVAMLTDYPVCERFPRDVFQCPFQASWQLGVEPKDFRAE